MEKIINRLIDEAVVNVDKYINGGSTLLIFTESKQWVIELTKDGTLWYNYNFFKNLFAYMSMDVVENQQYITNWVEDNIINGVKTTLNLSKQFNLSVEDTIQNGVKETKGINGVHGMNVTIQNGVKETIDLEMNDENIVEYIIETGVKHTLDETHHRRREVVRTIRDGIKQTCAQIPSIDDVVERVVEEGIKETYDDVYHHTARVEGVIKNSIKEVQPLPAQDGNMDWGVYYHRQEDRTKPHTQYVNDVIENGIKEIIL
jgi:hypothetical protein